MNSTFILFHAENVNDSQNSVCHLILIPVINSQPQNPHEFFFNPEAPFDWVMSRISSSQIESFPFFADQWNTVQSIFDQFDMAVCSADGYSARSLHNTLSRLDIPSNPINYCNAKAICRRSMNEVSYSLDFLSYRFFNDTIPFDDPVAIAKRWCDLVLKAITPLDDGSFEDFLNRVKIKKGIMLQGELISSLLIRDYSNRKKHIFDPTTIDINAKPENPLYGMNVVFTGKLDSMKRDDARAAVVSIGGNAPDRLTMETNYLVVGVQDLRVVGEKGLSGKMKSAAKFKEKGCQIEIIDETDFLEMLKF